MRSKIYSCVGLKELRKKEIQDEDFLLEEELIEEEKLKGTGVIQSSDLPYPFKLNIFFTPYKGRFRQHKASAINYYTS